jgi:hypothetical protein
MFLDIALTFDLLLPFSAIFSLERDNVQWTRAGIKFTINIMESKSSP